MHTNARWQSNLRGMLLITCFIICRTLPQQLGALHCKEPMPRTLPELLCPGSTGTARVLGTAGCSTGPPQHPNSPAPCPVRPAQPRPQAPEPLGADKTLHGMSTWQGQQQQWLFYASPCRCFHSCAQVLPLGPVAWPCNVRAHRNAIHANA